MNRKNKASRPTAAPKAMRLRERARAFKAQAEGLLKKADALLAEAERLEANVLEKETPRRENIN